MAGRHRRHRPTAGSGADFHPEGGGRVAAAAGPPRPPRPGQRRDVPLRGPHPAPPAMGRPGHHPSGHPRPARPVHRPAGHAVPVDPAGRHHRRSRLGPGPPRRPRALRVGSGRGGSDLAPPPGPAGRSARPVPAGEAAPPGGRLRRPAGPRRPRSPQRPGLRRGGPLAVPAPLGRRVPGRQRPPARAAVGLAGRPTRPLPRRRPQPGHLRLERGRPDPADTVRPA